MVWPARQRCLSVIELCAVVEFFHGLGGHFPNLLIGVPLPNPEQRGGGLWAPSSPSALAAEQRIVQKFS